MTSQNAGTDECRRSRLLHVSRAHTGRRPKPPDPGSGADGRDQHHQREGAEPPMLAPHQAPRRNGQPRGACGKADPFERECRGTVRGDVIERRERDEDRGERYFSAQSQHSRTSGVAAISQVVQL